MKQKVDLYENIYDEQFSFGSNWQKFLKELSDEKISQAQKSLQNFVGTKDFKGKTFLDFGCGSGLFSLSAILLGAKKVISVDVDSHSINCATYLRTKYNVPSSKWVIRQGSILDDAFVKSIEKADIVYSWGVLHHTGDMKTSLNNILMPMKPKGLLYIAIYNKFEGFPFSSNTWVKIKRFYSKRTQWIRTALNMTYAVLLIGFKIVRLQNPYTVMKKDYGARGMSFYRNIEDWLGGYPYEYASVQEIVSFYEKKGLQPIKINEAKREACNEFLFRG